MRQAIAFLAVLTGCVLIFDTAYSDQILTAQKVEIPPVIDGIGADKVWAEAEKITTHDDTADIDITLKAVYTGKEIFFLVSFPDPDESRTHKSWVWDKGRKLYRGGKDREDVFVFKWNMGPEPVDLSIHADNSYKADIWFWKAGRTDPVGYSDDKIQSLSLNYIEGTTELTSKTGKKIYLLRKEDSGTAAYRTELQIEYKGDVFPRFANQIPTGSRADVRAKGVWNKGRWTIEFGRALDTGNNDDVRFDRQKSFWFGVSRYEIAGRKENRELSQPLYGIGDISESLTLIFAK
ncbi:MAG TPA: hypothetical protein ENG95_00550 [Nitrospirae bacterium]|nr:ethylbenzene dehydrogenase [bacterium BMS3Abin10]GBE39611.1 ethylbenzene dehydrogenase [bacterium BMS3Bbin08]HDK81578.1 hypothetical protein [Nitrospirota bacterium]HDO25115.1 hypothetical protein [Nitrospirota bacterium]